MPVTIAELEALARDLFHRSDDDASGSLDYSEVRALFEKLGADLSDPKAISAAIKEIDEDEDGRINLSEFLEWWNKNNGIPGGQGGSVTSRTGGKSFAALIWLALAKIGEKLDETIMKQIEKDDAFEGLQKKNADKRVLMASFFMGKAAFAGALVYFTFTGIMTDQKARFIALDLTSGNCKQIPMALSGTYYLDQNGSWSGMAKYEAGRARLKLQLNGFQHSQDEYFSFMQDVQSLVQKVALKTPNYNLAINLMHWSSFGHKFIDGNNVHYIRFSGEVQSILDRKYMNAAYADVSGDCDVGSTTLWDVNSGRMGMHMSYTDVSANAACMEAMDPVTLGYHPEINGDDFTIHLDTRSLATAYAVNWDILPVDILVNVFEPLFDGKVIGCNPAFNTPGCSTDTYTFFMGFDPDLVGMAPIYCLKPVTRNMDPSKYSFTNLCAIRVVDQYVYPYVQHFGISGVAPNNPYEPKPCDCSSDDGKDPYCDDFDLMIGFVFFKTAANNVILNWQHLLDMAYRNDYVKLNEDIYHAAFAAQRTGGDALMFPPSIPTGLAPANVTSSRDKLLSPKWRNETYSFCNQNCTVFSFRLYDAINRHVNGASYNLDAGGCKDTFYDTSLPYDVAGLVPPAPLVQDYTECTNFLLASVIASFGIAMGTAAPITAGFVLLMCLIVGYVWEKFFGRREVEFATAIPDLNDGANGTSKVAEASEGLGAKKKLSKKKTKKKKKTARGGDSSSSEAEGNSGVESGSESERSPGDLVPTYTNPVVSGLELVNPMNLGYLFSAGGPGGRTAAPTADTFLPLSGGPEMELAKVLPRKKLIRRVKSETTGDSNV